MLAGALTAAALATAPWSPPQPIAPSAPGSPQLVFTRAGHGVVAFSSTAAAPLHTARLLAAASAGGGAFGRARAVGRLNLTVLATYGADRLIAFGTTGARHPRAAVAYGRPGARFDEARPLGPAGDGRVLAAAVDARGDAAALISAGGDPRLVVRRAGGEFGRAIRLGRGPARSGAVALDARGDALVAWERPAPGATGRRTVYSRRLTARGRLGAPRRIAVIGTGRYVAPPGVRVAIAGGRPLVAWTGYRDGRFVVLSARVGGAPQLLSDPARNTVLAALTAAPGGAVVALGRQGIRGNDPRRAVTLVAAVRAPGADAFGPLETVRAAPGYVGVPALAVDPVSGAPVAVWSEGTLLASIRASLASSA